MFHLQEQGSGAVQCVWWGNKAFKQLNVIVITVKDPLQKLTLLSQLLLGNTKIGYEALHLLNQDCRKPRCGKETKAGHNSMLSLKEEQEEEEDSKVQ